MKTPMRLGRPFRTVTLAGLALAAVAYGSAQIRQSAGPTPKPKPQTFQSTGNLANPMLVELGTLEQQVAGLQQGLNALQAENALLKAKSHSRRHTARDASAPTEGHRHVVSKGLTAYDAAHGVAKCCPASFNALPPTLP
jgi:hypothetical protein